VVAQGLRVLGADGGAVLTAHPAGGWRMSAVGTLPGDERIVGMRVPHDSSWPAAWAARRGRRLMLPTRASAAAFDPV
ncbi:hypothetical protein ACQUZK_10455, partial [Streptococcus pyogenes]|uniref:hypothetical protein n=1 Tax=Streptococcus pyogenes TaxID=1314 RepID=UPI003DA09FD3